MFQQIAAEMQYVTKAMTPGNLGVDVFRCLDLYKAPGGFTWGALKNNKGAEAYGITLSLEEVGHKNFIINADVKHMDITTLASEFGIDNIPDTHPDHFLFSAERPFLDQRFQLIFCGGAVLRSHDRKDYRLEFGRTRLTTSQLILAMQWMLPGGTMVILLRRPDSWRVLSLLRQFDSFATIKLFKVRKETWRQIDLLSFSQERTTRVRRC